jgi:hypothetical protein
MPGLNYELSPGPFEQGGSQVAVIDLNLLVVFDAIMRLSLLCKSGAVFPYFVAAQALAVAAVGGGFVEELRRRRLVEIADAQHFPHMPTNGAGKT